MKYVLFILTLSFFYLSYSQEKQISHVKKFAGIWVAEAYYHSLEKTKSPFRSKNTFNRWDPVALRINPLESSNDTLHIGFSNLAGHILHPEVSMYTTIEGEKVEEEGYFKLVFPQKDSSGYYKTLPKTVQGDKWHSQLRFDTLTNSIYYYRKPTAQTKVKPIKYIKVAQDFNEEYPFPNPLYFYLRKNILYSEYRLKDAQGNILSPKVEIRNNKIHGFPAFEGDYVVISTDLYDPYDYQEEEDILVFCKNLVAIGHGCTAFVFIRNEEGDLLLFDVPNYQKTENKHRLLYLLEHI